MTLQDIIMRDREFCRREGIRLRLDRESNLIRDFRALRKREDRSAWNSHFEAVKTSRREAIKQGILEIVGCVALIAMLAAFCWLCCACSGYNWQ